MEKLVIDVDRLQLGETKKIAGVISVIDNVITSLNQFDAIEIFYEEWMKWAGENSLSASEMRRLFSYLIRIGLIKPDEDRTGGMRITFNAAENFKQISAVYGLIAPILKTECSSFVSREAEEVEMLMWAGKYGRRKKDKLKEVDPGEYSIFSMAAGEDQ